jgi:hypothetical protein
MVTSVDDGTNVQKQQQTQKQQQPVQTMKEKMMATASFRQFQAAVHARVSRRRAMTGLLQDRCSARCALQLAP